MILVYRYYTLHDLDNLYKMAGIYGFCDPTGVPTDLPLQLDVLNYCKTEIIGCINYFEGINRSGIQK